MAASVPGPAYLARLMVRPHAGRSRAATVLLLLAGALGLLFAAPAETRAIVVPATVAVAGYGVFLTVLSRRDAEGLVGDIGFLYLGLLLVYTVVPATVLAWGLTSDIAGALSQFLPTAAESSRQLWRQVAFGGAFGVAYLAARGSQPIEGPAVPDPGHRRGRTVVITLGLVIACLLILLGLSAPVETYYDHYTRYDHLGWAPRKAVSLVLRLSLGLYCILFVFLFLDARKWRVVLPLTVLGLCGFEIAYSYGARIQALIVLLMALCLYHLTIRRISLGKLGLAGAALVLLFGTIELVRLLGDSGSIVDSVSGGGVAPPSEFLAVFLPSLQLYGDRAAGTLPAAPWPMFFNDLISLVTFGDFTEYMPMYWYARNYFPGVDVPPFTIGPVAETAIWWGEPELLVRGALNGIFFAWLVRGYLRFRDRWWGVSVYVYCYATCVLSLKYSIFNHVQLVEKNLLPAMLLVEGVRMFLPRRARPAMERTGGVADRTTGYQPN